MSGVRRDSLGRQIADPLIFGIMVIAVWAAIPVIFDLHPVLLPGPAAVWNVVWEYSYVLLPAMLNSAGNLGIGFAVGVAGGIGLGVLLHYSASIREAVYPFLVVVFVTPKAVFVPLLLLWFGTGDLYKVLIVLTMTFFPVLENTLAGLRGVQTEMIELSRSLGASHVTTLVKVRLPSALPSILAGVKLGVAEAFIGIVLAELLAPRSGIGALIMNASRSSATAFVIAGIVYIAVAGIATYFIFDAIEKRATFWQY